MENSTYMPTSLASPALMVLASTAEVNRETLHMQGSTAFPGQSIESKDLHIPFTASSFSMRSGYVQPDGFTSIPTHLLHLHNPFLTPGMDRGLSYINPIGSGAFRPVTATASSTEERNGFHSAFMPTTTKASKLDHVTGNFSHSMGNDVTFAGVLGRLSPQGMKDESSDKDTSSSLDLQERLTETPASDITDTTERSTPEEGRSLRRPKKRSLFDGQSCCCPVCGVTIRTGEIDIHFQQEVERLNKINRVIKKSSKDSPTLKNASKNSSNKKQESLSCPTDKNSPESRWESYNRVKTNRQSRLSAKAKGKKRKQIDETVCPICNERLSGTPDELNAHAEQCLRKRETEEDEQVDVEGESFDEYEWAGQTRIRATSLLQGGFAGSGFQTSSSRSIEDQDVDLNVDGDDTETFGQPQYLESDIIPCNVDRDDDINRQTIRGAVISSVPSKAEQSQWCNEDDAEFPNSHLASKETVFSEGNAHLRRDFSNSLDAALVIDSLKSQIKELEAQCSQNSKFKCLICMNSYHVPLVSVSCWHVHCEECWLRTLGAKKLCPQCNMITSPQDLRRIYL